MMITGRDFPRPSLWFMGVMRGCGCGFRACVVAGLRGGLRFLPFVVVYGGYAGLCVVCCGGSGMLCGFGFGLRCGFRVLLRVVYAVWLWCLF